MTAENLRRMLNKGAELIQDVEFVMFDEILYVSDAEVGTAFSSLTLLMTSLRIKMWERLFDETVETRKGKLFWVATCTMLSSARGSSWTVCSQRRQ